MATKVKIGGTISLPIDDAVEAIDWIEYQDRAWLVPVWIVAPDRKTQRPLRIIAPRFAPGYKPIPGMAILGHFRERPLPKALLEQGHIPPKLEQVVEVHENPDIYADTPGALD